MTEVKTLSSLLSVPVEVRESIYRYLFAGIYAEQRRRWDHGDSLPILRICSQIHQEASAFLFNRTPLRLKIGHRQQTSSLPPPAQVIDRFQNIYFDIETINSTHSGYDFEIPFVGLVDAMTRQSSSSSPPSSSSSASASSSLSSRRDRHSCYLRCDLEQYATVGYQSRVIQRHIKSFKGFETLTVHFEGSVQKSDFPQEVIADDDPSRISRLSTLTLKEGRRQMEEKALADADQLFARFEEVCGKGRVCALPESSDRMYGKILVVHPIRSVKA